MVHATKQADAVTREGVQVRRFEGVPEAGVVAEWQELASRVGAGRVAVMPQWLAVLERGLGHGPYALEARRGSGQLAGVLLLARVRSWLFGDALVSLPYVSVGGTLAEDEEAAGQLIDAAVELARELDVDYLQLRHERPVEHDALNACRSDKVMMRLELPDNPEALWKAVGPKVRNQVRKGERCGLAVSWGGEELLADFYRVFARNMRDLGTPVYPRSLFRAMLDCFGERCEICVVRGEGDQPYAAGILVHGDGSTEVPSASSLREYNSTCANMLMYWHLLKRAIERGQREFEFGRSTEGSGPYRFKKQWGAQPTRLHWQYHVRRGDPTSVRPDDDRFAWKVRLWRKLPLWLANTLGPRIARGIP